MIAYLLMQQCTVTFRGVTLIYMHDERMPEVSNRRSDSHFWKDLQENMQQITFTKDH